MASTVEENNVEYDSDPEEAKRQLTMRRREASDDEESEDVEEKEVTDKREDRRVEARSDELDDEGGVENYDDDDDDEGVEEGENGASGEIEVEGSVVVAKESDFDVRAPLEDSVVEDEDHSEDKKENEPFAVPTAGAFYMHDDRFRDNAAARNRRIPGGRRLWESKDDRKWGHDKFEEISVHEKCYEERRSSRGSYRGHSKSQGTVRGGYVQGNRKGYNDSIDQNQAPKSVVRGRDPKRHERTNKISAPSPQVQNKQYGKSLEITSNSGSERTSALASNTESDTVPAKNEVVASNLSYASPPFYPSRSSSKDNNLINKRDVQTGNSSRNTGPVAMDDGFPVQENNALLRVKNVVNSVNMEKLYIDESIRPSVGKPLNNVHMAPPRPCGVNASHSPHPRTSGTGRGASIPGKMNYQSAPSHNKVSPTQQAIQTSSAPERNSVSVQATAPQFGHRPGHGSQSSSPPKTSTSINSHDSGEMDATSESGKARGSLVGKGRGGSHCAGRGSFAYGGAQVMGTAGNVAVSHGDPNFPAFLPVMQFGGQHPGGIGVPAVGMAFPGYVAQPQLGSGKSEVTWLPVLAGAAGALGATYCSPYLAVDGARTRQSGQASVVGGSSKEHDVNKAKNELKPPPKSELANDEFGQRQNKPRRYSEMNFG